MAESKERGTLSTTTDVKSAVQHGSDDTSHADKSDGVERVFSTTEDLKDHTNYDLVDPDVAKYASEGGVVVSEEESKRLKRMIDKRVLTVMVFTYFLQVKRSKGSWVVTNSVQASAR
jgi:hypothetical protein